MFRACIRSRRLSFLVVVVGLSVAVARVVGAREEAPRLEFGNSFPLPPSLEENVRFWVDVFARYGLDEAVVHDRETPSHVLAVVPVATGRTREIDAVRQQFRHLTASLRTAAPAEIAGLIAPFGPPLDPRWLASAADRVRVQPGQREVFLRSILRSRRHLPMIRKVLARAELPLELAYLPHVESSFDADAESHAGALGLWQLMPETAKQRLLRVDAKVDERKHPYKSTVAATAYLRDAHDKLESWPLAITSYNYGINGTRRAVANVGSHHLDDVLEQHSSPLFGFASRNFYAQFLAALHVARNDEYFFPEIAEIRRREYVVQKGDTLWQIARRHGVTVDRIRSANKSLTESARLQLGQRIMMPG
jgi:membrane-bound lytic murein transglycosylase D